MKLLSMHANQRKKPLGVSFSPRYTLHVPTDKDGILEESLKLDTHLVYAHCCCPLTQPGLRPAECIMVIVPVPLLRSEV